MTTQTKLELLEERKRQVAAQISREKQKMKSEERKQDTRRRILLGALMLDWQAKGKVSEGNLRAELDVFLTQDRDRLLFGLGGVSK